MGLYTVIKTYNKILYTISARCHCILHTAPLMTLRQCLSLVHSIFFYDGCELCKLPGTEHTRYKTVACVANQFPFMCISIDTHPLFTTCTGLLLVSRVNTVRSASLCSWARQKAAGRAGRVGSSAGGTALCASPGTSSRRPRTTPWTPSA